MNVENEWLNLDKQLCFALYSSHLALNQKYRQVLAPLGITYPQYLVMLILWEKDKVTVSEIGKRIFLESSTLTPLLKRLQAQGLIERQRSQLDERQVIINLTQLGHAMRQQALAIPQSVLGATNCNTEDLMQLKTQLEHLRAALTQ